MRWLAEHRVNGVVMFRVGVDDGTKNLIAEWEGIAWLTASRDGLTSRFEPAPMADPLDVEKVRRGSAAMLLRHLQNKLSLHGAAVVINDRAILLTGVSGQGKSTLAAHLCNRGARLLSDDLAPIALHDGGCDVEALEPDLWLDAQARKWCGYDVVEPDGEDDPLRKLPVKASLLGTTAPLAAIVDLTFDDADAVCSRLDGLDALQSVLKQMVRFEIEDATRQRRELDLVASLVERVPVFRLVRRRERDVLAESSELIWKLARVIPSSGVV